ncbi:hypothetical protein EIP86_001979 [Pleurotus ostreatoroseus]|nr:hypothetical protein EIP86_001979 [Pleurotus ostreatoroseus]
MAEKGADGRLNTSFSHDGVLRTMLDFDCLTSVMPHIEEREDLLAFISTRSDLYAAGIAPLLHFPYTIDEDNLEEFHAFLVSKQPTSFLALRALTFDFDTLRTNGDKLSTVLIEILSNLFKHAKKLETLHIDIAVLCQDDFVPLSISSLTTLKCLKLYGTYDDKVGYMLSRLQSPLEVIGDIVSNCKGDPLPFLANFQETLREATLLDSCCCDNEYFFSNLTFLNITPRSLPYLPLLLPTFPYLEDLTIGSVRSLFKNKEFFEQLREVNMEFQAECSEDMWCLNSLSADMRALYGLGLQDEVPCLTVTGFSPSSYPDDFLEEIDDVFGPLNPLYLTLSGFHNPPGDTTNLSALFQPDAGLCSVKRLDLVITFTPDIVNPHNYISQVFMLACEIMMAPPRIVRRNHSSRAEDYLARLSLRDLAQRVKRALGSLTFVQLKIRTFEDERNSYWRFDTASRPVELPSDKPNHVDLRKHFDAVFKLAAEQNITAEDFDEFLEAHEYPEAKDGGREVGRASDGFAQGAGSSLL